MEQRTVQSGPTLAPDGACTPEAFENKANEEGWLEVLIHECFWRHP